MVQVGIPMIKLGQRHHILVNVKVKITTSRPRAHNLYLVTKLGRQNYSWINKQQPKRELLEIRLHGS